MDAYKVEGFLMQAILDEEDFVVITIKGEDKSIFLKGVSYSGIKSKDGIIEFTPENEESVSLNCEEISNIKCL